MGTNMQQYDYNFKCVAINWVIEYQKVPLQQDLSPRSWTFLLLTVQALLLQFWQISLQVVCQKEYNTKIPCGIAGVLDHSQLFYDDFCSRKRRASNKSSPIQVSIILSSTNKERNACMLRKILMLNLSDKKSQVEHIESMALLLFPIKHHY